MKTIKQLNDKCKQNNQRIIIKHNFVCGYLKNEQITMS